MKRPSFQFYPSDWLGNPNLKRCTHAEKGMWADILCLLSDGDQFGVLRWPLKEIATAIGVSSSALKGLVSKNVLKGSDTRCAAFVYVPRSGRKDGDPVTLIEEQDGPLWFSSRMVTDEYKASVREKNLPKTHQKSSLSGSPMAGNGEPKDAHPSVHPSVHRLDAGASRPAPSSSSSSSSSSDSKTDNSLRSLSAPARERASRGTRWPHGQPIPPDWLEKARKTLPSLDERLKRRVSETIDVQIESVQFVNHFSSKNGPDALHRDWDRTWQNWILNAAKRAPLRLMEVGNGRIFGR